jgi:hypothetical protein
MPPAVPEVVRSLIIGNQTVAYQLRRSQRRTIGLAIDQRGLRVGAPAGPPRRHRSPDSPARPVGARQTGRLAGARRPRKLKITDGTVIPLLGEP